MIFTSTTAQPLLSEASQYVVDTFWAAMLPQAGQQQSTRKIKLPQQGLRSLLSRTYAYRNPRPQALPSSRITVICISDAHNTKSKLPNGDLLLHAGDLSNWGPYKEFQDQVTWLSEQPHCYKVVIAGDYNLILDAEFRTKYPQTWRKAQEAAGALKEGQVKTAKDIDWGNVVYLQGESVILQLPNGREINIYGSPLTPAYGVSAFQYTPRMKPWKGKIPSNTDTILTHGPPCSHLDSVKQSGCTMLAEEVVVVRTRLVVFGHIHVGHGTEEIVYDSVGRAYEKSQLRRSGRGTLIDMTLKVILGRCVPRTLHATHAITTFVNAAVVEGWEDHQIKNEAVVLRL